MIFQRLFGFNEEIISECDKKEIYKYKLLSIVFIVLLFVCFFSSNYFFYLLFNSYLFGLIGSVFLSFILFSLLRLTVISINVPLDEEITLKRLMFNSGNILRLIIFSVLLFSLLVPFTSMFFNKSYTSLIDKYKDELVYNYSKSLKISSENKNKVLRKELADLKNDLNELNIQKSKSHDENEILLFSFRIRKQEHKIDVKRLEFQDVLLNQDDLFKVKTKVFRGDLLNVHFPFIRFGLVFKQGESILIFLVLFILFSIFIPLYVYSLVDKNNKYSRLYQTFVKERIINDYNKNIILCNTYLNKKYKGESIPDSIYLDSPFNKVLKVKNINKIDQSTYDNFLSK